MKQTYSKKGQTTITVLVVDDHALARQGIINALKPMKDILVVGEAGDGIEAIKLVEKFKPDVVSLDLNMPKSDGIETVRHLKHAFPATKIIIVSAFATGFFPKYLKRMRVDGYVSKDDAYAEIVTAIRSVHQQHAYFSTAVAQGIALDELTQQESLLLTRLTKKELNMVLQIVQGKSNEEIGEKFHVSPKTVASHRSRILRKLELASEVELLYLAIRDKFLLNPNF